MIKFLIIGLGTIGYRHFESLYKCNEYFSIDCYDISEQSISRVKNYVNLKKKKHKVKFLRSLNKLDKKYDFLIHATSSNIRLKTLKKILKNTNIKFCILEKLLAQNLNDLNKFKLIFKNIENCWVNTPMHEWDLYIKFKKKINIDNVSKIEFNYFDGLACNAIHFIDFVSTWKKQLPKNLDTSKLKNWYKSKRNGFFDVYGKLIIVYPDNTILVLKSYKNKKNYHCHVYEKNNKWTLIENEKKFYSTNGFKQTGVVEYQSQLTSKIIKKIIKSKKCELPKLDWSIECHIPFLKSLLKYWNSSYNTNIKNLPIT